MKIYSFASSSDGNCYVVEKDNTRIMIECGIPLKKIINKLSFMKLSLNAINCCLISHNHNDHSYAMEDLQQLRGVQCFLGKGFEKNDLKVIPYQVDHGVETCYAYDITIGDERLLFATDFSKFLKNEDLASIINIPFDYIMIECNWDDEIMDSLPKSKKFARQKNTHMGLSGVISYLKAFNLSKCKEIYLMHLSDQCSNEIKMQALVQEATKIKTYVCKKDGGVW